MFEAGQTINVKSGKLCLCVIVKGEQRDVRGEMFDFSPLTFDITGAAPYNCACCFNCYLTNNRSSK